MAENNEIYELTKLIGDREGFERDFSDIMGNFKEILQKKYISKLHTAANAQQNAVVEHPPKEVTLLRALREFADEPSKNQMNQLIDIMLFMNTVQSVQKNLSTLTQSHAQTIHQMSNSEDGAPIEPDSFQASAQITGILLTMALAKII